jgi:outer membrane protein assembly factor BamB
MFLGLALPAYALEELWHADLRSAVQAYPLVAEYDGQGAPEVFVPTRLDGTLWILRPDGSLNTTLKRDRWLEGSVAGMSATNGASGYTVFQQSDGLLSLIDASKGLFIGADRSVAARAGLSPCFVDVDAHGMPEIVTIRNNGLVTVQNTQLIPLWVFDAGAPIDVMPAGAPLFRGQGALFVLASNGRLHGLSGQGRPLWHYDLPNPPAAFPSSADPIVAQLSFLHPSVLVSDASGWLYAVNCVSGREEWRVQIGQGPLGSPAIIDVRPTAGREIVVASEAGDLAILDSTGSVVSRAALPPGRYVPRPVIADIEGDGQVEIVLPNSDWQLVVASLDGVVKETLPLRGNVTQGAVLADVNADGKLELIAATDCARAYCYTTHATEGWTHPRANTMLNGCVDPIPPTAAPNTVKVSRSAIPDEVVLPEFTKENSSATAWIHFDSVGKAVTGSVVIRQGEIVLGSATKALRRAGMTVPYVRFNSDAITLDLYLYDGDNRLIASTENFVMRPRVSQPVPLDAPEPLFRALDERAKRFPMPEAWKLARVGERDSWHVTRFMPEEWQRYGLADEAFIREALPRVPASASSPSTLFSPARPEWDVLAKSRKPFFLLNDPEEPKLAYPDSAFRAIEEMAGTRFLGFPVEEWACRVWDRRWTGGNPRPTSTSEALAILEQDFERVMRLCHGKVYEGEGPCLFHHLAYKWGAPMGYAQVGANTPSASLQFAFLRGASRQYGNRPWGASISNRFAGALADTRFRGNAEAVTWTKGGEATGPDCGHSASLELRLEMAAHLAGATFVQHESDARHGSVFMKEDSQGRFELSDFGKSLRTWHEYARAYPERGTPYTPVAFLVDPEQGWRPGDNIFGIWPRERADLSMEAIFAKAFPSAGLDFERGYLSSGPYGDVFDVLTADATQEVLHAYPVIWPAGRLSLTPARAEALETYVRQGGILVLDSAMTDAFTADFVGARFKDRYAYGNQIQTALDTIPPFGAPYRYRPMWVLRGSSVLAHTDDGAPLAVWRREGEGIVIASGTQDWSDEANRALPIVPALLKSLVQAFVPVRVEGNVEILINRMPAGWVIGLINNNGVLKAPTLPPDVVAEAAQDCVLRFQGAVPLRFVSRMGEFRWNATADGLLTRLQPGQVAVLEIVLGSSAAPASPPLR